MGLHVWNFRSRLKAHSLSTIFHLYRHRIWVQLLNLFNCILYTCRISLVALKRYSGGNWSAQTRVKPLRKLPLYPREILAKVVWLHNALMREGSRGLSTKAGSTGCTITALPLNDNRSVLVKLPLGPPDYMARRAWLPHGGYQASHSCTVVPPKNPTWVFSRFVSMIDLFNHTEPVARDSYISTLSYWQLLSFSFINLLAHLQQFIQYTNPYISPEHTCYPDYR